jgi:hypothetical protein
VDSDQKGSVIVAIPFECTTEKFQFSWDTILVTDGCSSVYQSEQHRVLICWMVVKFDILVEVGVGHFPVYSVTQRTIWSSVYNNVQEGKVATVILVHEGRP